MIDAALLARVGEKLSKRGSKVTLRLGEPTPDISRGFVLRSGRILETSSTESLVREARDRLEPDVYGRLFGEEAAG